MEWIKCSERSPDPGMFIAGFRKSWPAFYWIGTVTDETKEQEDMIEYWIELPEFPKE